MINWIKSRLSEKSSWNAIVVAAVAFN